MASFPKEIIKAPRRWCENAYAITHWADMPRAVTSLPSNSRNCSSGTCVPSFGILGRQPRPMSVILAYGSPPWATCYRWASCWPNWRDADTRCTCGPLSAGVSYAERLGLHAEAVDTRIEAVQSRDWDARGPFGVLKMTLDVLCRRAELEVADLGRAIADVRPDALIIDANCWGAISVADAGTLPWAVFSPFTPFLHSRGMPPVGPECGRGRGVPGAVRDHGVRLVVRRVMDRPVLPASTPCGRRSVPCGEVSG